MSRDFGTCGSITVSGGLPKLAANLSWPSTPGNGLDYEDISETFTAGVLSEILNRDGRFSLSHLVIKNQIAETTTIVLTIDGEVVMNDIDFTSFTTTQLIGSSSTIDKLNTSFLVESNITLEIKKATDTSVDIELLLTPITT